MLLQFVVQANETKGDYLPKDLLTMVTYDLVSALVSASFRAITWASEIRIHSFPIMFKYTLSILAAVLIDKQPESLDCQI